MRFCLCLLALTATFCLAQSPAGETLRGKLLSVDGSPASVEIAGHAAVTLDGDEDTRKILRDHRLNGYQLEARGHFTAPNRFLVDPIHTRALMVRQNGRLKIITYFCDVCNIRAYTPGPCACCQRETTLDLRDPDQK